jgi:elongation factor P
MFISAIDVKVGFILRHKNGLFKALKTEHVKPGKGGAFMQVELKEIINGTKINERFRSDERVEKVSVDPVNSQFLYMDGNDVAFMNLSSYEQFSVSIDMFDEDREKFLFDGMELVIEFIDEKPINIVMPQKVQAVVKEAQAAIKGQTVTNSFKPAVLDNGVSILVPAFIKEGDKIVVKTEDLTYFGKV